MTGWEGWVIAISSIIIALGMIVMISIVVALLIAVKRLVNGANKAIGIFRFAEADPVGELMDSVRSFFDKKGKMNKVAAVLKCALIGLLLWQKMGKRRR